MGLLSKKYLGKAKQLAEKNAGKIAQGVDKATDKVNAKTGGKYADKLKKVDDAAKKFAADSGHPVEPPEAAQPSTTTDAEPDDSDSAS